MESRAEQEATRWECTTDLPVSNVSVTVAIDKGTMTVARASPIAHLTEHREAQIGNTVTQRK